jgi:flagellar motor switch protein FliN/FliY
MTNDSPAVTVFVDAWLPEFARAVEMSTGAAVTPIAAPGAPSEAADPEGARVWHEQTFDRGERGSAWIGIAQSAVSFLTGTVAADEQSQFALVHELLTQSMKGAAMCLGTGEYPGIRCLDTFTTEPPPETAVVSTAWFAASGGQPLAVDVYVSRELHELLGAKTAASPEQPPSASARRPDSVAALDRFAGVSLPVALVLGRAALRVREVLELRVGSIVELDKQAGQPVDVCVHNAIVARGEVVSVHGNYGVRILELTDPQGRADSVGSPVRRTQSGQSR